MTDWLGTTSYALDLLGRVQSVNDHNSKTTSYEYDAAGNKTKITYPDGTDVIYGYDLMNRLTSANEGGAVTTYSYDSVGRLASKNYPNGTNEAYTYDNVGRLTKTTDQTGVLATYSYDNNGNVTAETKRIGNVNNTYAYDELNRLIQSNSDTYAYDTLGNLIREVKGGQTINYSYNNLNQLVSKNDGTITNFTYDGRGNLTAKTGAVTETFTYNAMNKLASGTTANGTSTYTYNGKGTRVAVNDKTFVIDYTSPLQNVIMEYENSDTVKHVYGVGEISIAENGTKSYIHEDRQGSISHATNTSGTMTDYITFDPWGVITHTPTDVLQRYTVHKYDDTLELYYANARMYDANNRRFISIDPIKAGNNWYAYCGDNPTSRADATGLAWFIHPYDGKSYWLGESKTFKDYNGGNPVYELRKVVAALRCMDGNDAADNAIAWDKKTKTAKFYISQRGSSGSREQDEEYTYTIANVKWNINDSQVVTVRPQRYPESSKEFQAYFSDKYNTTYVSVSEAIKALSWEEDYFGKLICTTNDDGVTTHILPSPESMKSAGKEELKNRPKALANLADYASESDASVISRLLFGEDAKSISAHLWVLENRRLANERSSGIPYAYSGSNTFRGLALGKNQFSCMWEDRSLNPASTFGGYGEKDAWFACVDAAYNYLDNGIGAVNKGEITTQTMTFSALWGNFNPNNHKNVKRVGNTYFYND